MGCILILNSILSNILIILEVFLRPLNCELSNLWSKDPETSSLRGSCLPLVQNLLQANGSQSIDKVTKMPHWKEELSTYKTEKK